MAPDPAEPNLLADARRVHLVGVGGSGMSSLASLLHHRGKQVSGSDLSPDAAARLAREGIQTRVGHDAKQLGQPDLIVVSAAIPPENPELVEARRRKLPVLTHAQALGQLMRGQIGVGVAGTHGKTTTTALLGYILDRVGLDPTVLVGAIALDFGSGARPGRGPHFVVEADEYDRRFLELRPRVAIITGIEPDHLDYYRDLAEIVTAFEAFAERLPPDGLIITSADDPVLAALPLPCPRLTYGRAPTADWHLAAFHPRPGGGCSFDITTPSDSVTLELQLTGLHNARNATAALAAAVHLGAPLDAAAATLPGFQGTERRFQTVARPNNIWLVDDYAHHPTAIRATLEAARQVHGGRLWAVFQPHTTNRVAELLADFATAFEPADRLTLLPIYRPPGRERAERPVTSATLAAAIQHPPVHLAESLEQAETELARDLRPGDLALIMGAGDVTRLSQRLAEIIPGTAGVSPDPVRPHHASRSASQRRGRARRPRSQG